MTNDQIAYTSNPSSKIEFQLYVYTQIKKKICLIHASGDLAYEHMDFVRWSMFRYAMRYCCVEYVPILNKNSN